MQRQILRSVPRTMLAASILMIATALTPGALAQCDDPAMECGDPCPAANSCGSPADCPDGFDCVPFGAGLPCVPSVCFCSGGAWACTDDCASQCVEAPGVPASSESGLAALLLSLLVAAAVVVALRSHQRSRRGPAVS